MFYLQAWCVFNMITSCQCGIIHNDKGTLVLLGVSVGFVAGWEEFDLSFLVCFLYDTILFETVILIHDLFYCACCCK